VVRLVLGFKLVALQLVALTLDPLELLLNIIDDPIQLPHPVLEDRLLPLELLMIAVDGVLSLLDLLEAGLVAVADLFDDDRSLSEQSLVAFENTKEVDGGEQ